MIACDRVFIAVVQCPLENEADNNGGGMKATQMMPYNSQRKCLMRFGDLWSIESRPISFQLNSCWYIDGATQPLQTNSLRGETPFISLTTSRGQGALGDKHKRGD